jgi:hypothetical protein
VVKDLLTRLQPSKHCLLLVAAGAAGMAAAAVLVV